MGPVGHVIVSAPLSAVVWASTHDPIAAGTAFTVGVCIDVDHVIDYVRARGLKIDIHAIRTGAYFRETGQAIVLLHSYELVAIASVLAWRWYSPAVGSALLLGAMAHLVSDLAFYRFRPSCYSLSYRLATQFSLGSFRALHRREKGGAAI